MAFTFAVSDVLLTKIKTLCKATQKICSFKGYGAVPKTPELSVSFKQTLKSFAYCIVRAEVR